VVWACSCTPPSLNFLGLWSYTIDQGSSLPIVVECVAVNTECEGIVYLVNNILYTEFASNLLVGDLIKVWNGDGVSCNETLFTSIGDTAIIALSPFNSSYAIGFEEACEPINIGAYKNYVVSYCGPTIAPVYNGVVGQGAEAIPLEDFGDMLVQATTANFVATELDFRLMLEGAYHNGQMTPLLNDYLPNAHPYNDAPYHHSQNLTIYNLPNFDNIVDWVLIEARSGTPNTSGPRNTVTVETQAALINSEGYLICGDGDAPVLFYELVPGQEYYFCIRHRNHLDVLTAQPLIAGGVVHYDFTQGLEKSLGNSQQKWDPVSGMAMLHAGDYNQDGVIQATDFDLWSANPAISNAYSVTDGTLDGFVQATDFDIWTANRAKIGNPEIGF